AGTLHPGAQIQVRRMDGSVAIFEVTSVEKFDKSSLPAERVPEALASVVLRAEDARQRFLSEGNPVVRATLVEEAVLLLLAELAGTAAAEA
ncbi:MAG: hypothetical protein ACK4YP_13725, partial [Myxococcota bacterium]